MTTAALDAATLEKLISAAVAVPAIDGSRPWRCRLDPATTTIEVHVAGGRAPLSADATGQALHLSAGAAVFNLRAAIAHFGWTPVVELLPDPAEPGFLAAVRLAGPRPDGNPCDGAELYDAVWRRHSSRFPFDGPPVPGDVRAEITEAATAEGAILVFAGPQETVRILRLTAPDELAALDGRPALAVLGTLHDRPADWLRAGQGMERALLVATTHGVRASLLDQAGQRPGLHRSLRDPRGGTAHVQLLIRFEYGPGGPAAPRRPVGEPPGPTR